MAVHFCEKTGVRIAAPGVSKAVDPEKGHDEVVEEAPPTPEFIGAELVEPPKVDGRLVAAIIAQAVELGFDPATLEDIGEAALKTTNEELEKQYRDLRERVLAKRKAAKAETAKAAKAAKNETPAAPATDETKPNTEAAPPAAATDEKK